MNALVLSGGGTRSVAHLGVLDELAHRFQWEPDILIGTSGGGLVAALWGAGVTVSQRAQLLASLQSAVRFHGRREVIALAWKEALRDLLQDQPIQGVLTATPLFRHFTDILGNPHIRMRELPRQVILVAFNLTTARQILFPSFKLTADQLFACHQRSWEVAPLETPLIDAMHATMALPGLFRPHQIGSAFYVDGGVVDNFALDVAELLDVAWALGVNLGGHFTPVGTAALSWSRIVSDAIWSLLADATQAREATITIPRVILQPVVAQFVQTDLADMGSIYEAGRAAVQREDAVLQDLLAPTVAAQ